VTPAEADRLVAALDSAASSDVLVLRWARCLAVDVGRCGRHALAPGW
jgi:hypothetical protein